MRAAVLTQIKIPLSVESMDPMPLEIGQVLVRVSVSGICGAQLQEIAGEKGDPRHCPHLLGHEGCGIVLAVGAGVKTVKPGDKVVMHWRPGDGIDAEPAKYTQGYTTIRGGKITTFAQEAVVSENRVTAIPMDTPDDFAAMLGCGLSTALGTMESEAKLKIGESVLIVGCGGLGLNLILAAKLCGAAQIAAIDIIKAKQDRAVEAGATAMGLAKFDVIVDTTGAHLAIEQTLQLLKSGGRYVMVGQQKPGEGFIVYNSRAMFDGEGRTIIFTQGGKFQPHTDIPRYIQMYQSGLINITGVISHRVTLDQINKGIEMVTHGQAGRVMIDL